MLTGKWLHITNSFLTGAFIGLLVLIYVNKPAPIYRRVQKANMVLGRASTLKKVEHRHRFTLSMMKDEILKIAPEVYYAVRLELEGGGHVSEKNPAHADLKSLAIKFVEVFTRSQSWDTLKSQERIDLLNSTFKLLKRRYPFLKQSVRLVFDDSRRKLEFKIGHAPKTGRPAPGFRTRKKHPGHTGISYAIGTQHGLVTHLTALLQRGSKPENPNSTRRQSRYTDHIT